MPEYKDYNDNELLEFIREKNEDAEEILFQKYKPVVDLKAAKYIKLVESNGVEYKDLFQEGMIGLSEAIRDYDETSAVKFYTFASICIERQIVTALTKANRYKNRVLNSSISLDYVAENTTKALSEFLVTDTEENPEEKVLNHEYEQELDEKLKQLLTPNEMQVYELKKAGFTYREMMELLEKDYKAIDNAMQRIKAKIKKVMKKEG